MGQSGRGWLERVAKIAASRQVGAGAWRALMAFGPRALGYGAPSDELEVLLVASRFGPRVKCAEEEALGISVFLIITDEKVLERDVKAGVLGELLADKLLVPYVPVEGADFLSKLEVELKERLARELLLDLASNFPKFAPEIYVDPRYFLYETITRMARTMPSSTYMFANVLARQADRAKYEPMIMEGFRRALRALESEGLVVLEDGLVRPTARLLKRARRGLLASAAWAVKGALRSLGKYTTKVLVGVTRPYLLEEEAFYRRFSLGARINPLRALPRPEDFLLLKTSVGFVPALREVALEEIARAVGPVGPRDDVLVSEIGGSLNVVYLVAIRSEEGTVRFVVKRFRNWDNLKWFSIRLWALGAKRFVISGRERLRREYTMCRKLEEMGFPVPRIFHVDLKSNTLVEEFIEGANLSDLIRAFSFGEADEGEVLGLLEEAGRLVAEVHRAGVALGDCKPENMIVGREGRLFIVDLEQASEGGDMAWDVAEFLYYTGHYIPSVASAEPFKLMAKAFVEGYLRAGGSPELVRKAPSARFARVFSILTPSHVIEAIYEVCGVGAP